MSARNRFFSGVLLLPLAILLSQPGCGDDDGGTTGTDGGMVGELPGLVLVNPGSIDAGVHVLKAPVEGYSAVRFRSIVSTNGAVNLDLLNSEGDWEEGYIADAWYDDAQSSWTFEAWN